MSSYLRRRKILGQVLEALKGELTERPMIIKGASLASLYETPAVRMMCDIDLVLPPTEVKRFREAMEALGWKAMRHVASTVWRDEVSGLLIDVQVPRSAEALKLYRVAQEWDEFPGAVRPRFQDHAVIVARHCAHDGGGRIWRDMADMWAVAEESEESNEEFCELVYMEAHDPEIRGVLNAFFRFMNRWSGFDSCGRESTPVTVEIEKTLDEVYRCCAADPLPPVMLNLLRTTPSSLRQRVASVRSLLFEDGEGRKQGDGEQVVWMERDPSMGDLPAPGKLSRAWLKLKLVFALAMKGQLVRYISLMRMQNRASLHRKMFEDPGT